uniref:N(4)-(Beta-N-acetylglucosaminyl)-L-asparaginase n=1 Tax=Acrobeloides nanus TaxID=290746 RepID=A0A914CQY1_9BILA
MYLPLIFLYAICANGYAAKLPLVISTWAHSTFPNATQKAWEYLKSNGDQRLGALVEGLSTCEALQCDHTVGYGGSPDETGETTLDALVMDGSTHQIGAVGDLRQIKDVARVAWAVMNFTEHSLLVGDQAMKFALEMGFTKSNLTTNVSIEMHQNWIRNNCQPNFWKVRNFL